MKLPTDCPAIAAAWLIIALSSAVTRATNRSCFRIGREGFVAVIAIAIMCTKVAHTVKDGYGGVTNQSSEPCADVLVNTARLHHVMPTVAEGPIRVSLMKT